MQPKTKMQSIIHKKIISLLVKATNVASLRTKASVLITNII